MHVNTWHIYDAALPFGGYTQSGWDARWAKWS